MARTKKPYVPSLPPEVRDSYRLKDWKGGPRQNFGRFGTVDLEKLNVNRARALVRSGFPYLEAVEVEEKEDLTED